MKYKATTLICIVFLCLPSIGCAGVEDNHREIANNNENQELSDRDLTIIKKWNKNAKNYLLVDGDDAKNQLKKFIPQAFKIENKKERNAILLRIYTHTKMYPEALALTNSMLIENPDDASTQKIKCELLKSSNESEKVVQNCYFKEASLIRNQLNTTSPRDPSHLYVQWAYYIAMYNAGNKEYMNNLKNIINSQKTELKRMQFRAVLHLELPEVQLP